MAGILDEVMEGIAKTEPEQKAPAQTEAPKTEQTAKTEENSKAMHGYSDQFKDKYGGRKQ